MSVARCSVRNGVLLAEAAVWRGQEALIVWCILRLIRTVHVQL
jgi:hypothetical protein